VGLNSSVKTIKPICTPDVCKSSKSLFHLALGPPTTKISLRFSSNDLYLVVDDYNTSVNNNFYSLFNSSLLNKNILARISLQTSQFNPFNLVEQNNLANITTPREYFGPVNIQALTIQLLDEYGRILQLNNMDFSFCLTLTTIYDL
jgi:hypothetical protein